MNWATAFCKVFSSCVCWLLSLNPRKPASCLGQIPVYHPKGISLTHSIVHRSHSWTHSLPNTSNTWTFLFFFSRSFWQEIWWTGTSTTRWAGRSLATRWSSTISIENRFRRKGQSFFVRKSNIFDFIQSNIFDFIQSNIFDFIHIWNSMQGCFQHGHSVAGYWQVS